ncbi:MAG: DUF4124 domain-containing protein [Pseudomonadota bacterium]
MPVSTLFRLTLIAAIASFSVSAHAQIYKWVDEDGVVHYADQPQSKDAVTSDIQPSRTNAANVSARLNATAKLGEEQASRRGGEEEPEVPDETDELVRQASCAAARKKMNQFTQARRLYKLDEDGAKAYLTEDETLAARAEVQAKITEFCN